MDSLKIYVDRLKHGEEHPIAETLPATFMELEDEELAFNEPISVSGKAYLADDHLIVCFDVSTRGLLPCSVCNEPVIIPIHIKNACHTQPLTEIKGAIYHCGQEIRETILLNTPLFIECHAGKCPEREHVQRFLKGTTQKEEATYLPFTALTLPKKTPDSSK